MDLISASIIALIFGLTTALSFCAIHTLSTVAIFSIGSKKDLKFYPSLIALGHFSAITLIGVMVIFVASLVKEYLTFLQIPAILSSRDFNKLKSRQPFTLRAKELDQIGIKIERRPSPFVKKGCLKGDSARAKPRTFCFLSKGN